MTPLNGGRTKDKKTVMSKGKAQVGICRICKTKKRLTFEHVPPKVAFNKHTRYYSIPMEEYSSIKNPLEINIKGQIQQGGHGYYSLCGECNSFLNKYYVRSYSNWANIGMSLLLNYNFDYIHFYAEELNPKRVLKHIISMFISMNDTWFTEQYPELLEFVKFPENNNLPNKYRLFCYLNNEGQMRMSKWNFTNTHGIICESTFRPYGYVLNIENNESIDKLTDISNFKDFSDERNHTVELGLYKHPTYLPIPLDFRSKEEIEQVLNEERKTSR